MGQYTVNLTDLAKKQLNQHEKAGNRSTINRINKIIEELAEHLFTGIGKPEALKYDLPGFWSRRISKKDRMIYEVFEKTITVDVVSAMGHYGEK